jgi:putative intracellular protease/amidase
MKFCQKMKNNRILAHSRHWHGALLALSLLLFNSQFSHAVTVDSGAISLLSGNASSAKFSIGTLVDNGAYAGTAFDSKQKITVLCKLDVPAEQVGKDAKIHLVAKYKGNLYMVTQDNTWIPWNGDPSSLVSNIAKLTLKTTQQDFIHTSITGVTGDLQLFIGYSVDNDIYHNNTPLSFSVSAAPNNKPLSHAELMMVQPEPNIRPTYDANKAYLSGGIGILVYDGVNAMDVLGPFQVFSTAGLRPMLISASKDSTGAYKTLITTNSGLQLTANRTIANTDNLEVLVLTGGAVETATMAQDPGLISWVKKIDKTSIWTTSVCTGSWILGASGLLQGKMATSNWYRADELLAHFGAIPMSNQRYLFDGKIVTAAGVTAGIDMALALVKTVFKNDNSNGHDFTQSVMLDIQYDPDPPIKGGSAMTTLTPVYDGMTMMYDMAGEWYGLGMSLGDYIKTIPVQ